MKILICSFTGFKIFNGANLRLYYIIKELINRKHEVDIIVPGYSDAETIKKEFDINAKYFNIEMSRFSVSKVFLYPLYSIKAYSYIKKYNPDLVFGQSLPPALAIALSSCKCLKMIDMPDLWSEYYKCSSKSIFSIFVYIGIKVAEIFSAYKSDIITTVTNIQRINWKKYSKKTNNVFVVNEGVDTRMFNKIIVPNEFINKYGLTTDKYIICQGGIERHDGIQNLFKIFNKIKDKVKNVKILIVGTGIYLHKLKKLAEKYNINEHIKFTGWVPYEDMPYFLNISTICLAPLLPSKATEGIITIKVLEALASQTPLVAPKLPGIEEVIIHKVNGYLYNPYDNEDMANACIELLENDSLRKSISINARKDIERYDWRVGAINIADIIENSYKNDKSRN